MTARYRWNGPRVMAAFRGAVSKGLLRSAGIVQQEVRKQLNKHGKMPSKGVSVGGTPGVRTGHLRRSWQMGALGAYYNARGIADPIRPRVVVGSNVKYARIHEFGGVIRAKRSKYLTIPLNRDAQKLITTHGSTRNIPGLFRVGNALAMKRGKRGKLVFLFALKRSVRIPKRPYIKPALVHARPRVYAEFSPAMLMRGMNVRTPR